MELDCRDCDEGLVEFLYGEFDDERTAAFERHLRSCTKCAAAVEELREMRSLFGKLEEAEPSAAGLDAIMAAAESKAAEMGRVADAEREAEERPASLWAKLLESLRGAALRPALGTAFMLVVVAGVGLIYLGDRPQPRSLEGVGSSSNEGLVSPPRGELQAAAPTMDQERSAPVLEEQQEEALDDEIAEPAPERDVVAQRPPIPRPSKNADQPPQSKRTVPPQRERRNARSSRDSAALAGDLDRGVEQEDIASRSAPSKRAVASNSPLVIDARQVPTELERSLPPTPPQPAPRQNRAFDDGESIVPTPPLPQAGEQPAPEEAQAQPGTPTSTPAPAPVRSYSPPSSSAGTSGLVQQPQRIPTPGQASYDRGMQAYRSGRYNDAADELNEFVRSPSAPNHLMPQGLHALAVSQTRAGNLSAAARNYERLLSRHRGYSRRPQAMLEAAQLQARLGNYTAAERLLEQLAGVPGWSTRAQAERARLQHRRAAEQGDLGPANAVDAAEEAADMPASSY